MPLTLMTPHFSLEEATFSSTATRLGLDNTPDSDTVQRMLIASQSMERVRDLLGYSIHVDSWYRSLRVNRAIGSKDTSDHVLGWAIDFLCPQYGTPLEVCKTIAASGIEFHQLIWEHDWTHISFNPVGGRTIMTAQFDTNGVATYRIGLPDE